jgi:hypothetical protein
MLADDNSRSQEDGKSLRLAFLTRPFPHPASRENKDMNKEA